MSNSIILSDELGILGIKFCGVILIILASLYLLYIILNKNDVPLPSRKKLIILSLIFGVLNAGLALSFGKLAFFITPLFIAITFLLWISKRLPQWTLSHLIIFLSIFIVTSIVVFIFIAAIFFHLAVEGKL